MKVSKSTDVGMRHYFLKEDLTVIHKLLDELLHDVEKFKKIHGNYDGILSRMRETLEEVIGEVEDVDAELGDLGDKLSDLEEEARL